MASIGTLFGCSSTSVHSNGTDASEVDAESQQTEAELTALRAKTEEQDQELRALRGQLALARAEANDLKATRSRRGASAKSIRIPEADTGGDNGDELPFEENAQSSEARLNLRIYGDEVERLPTTSSVADLPSFDAPPTPTSDAVEVYRHGLSLIQGQQFSEALSVLQEFLASNGEHPYTDNALFWCGEIHFLRREYTAALEEFQRIEQQYPRGNKLPDALYRMGQIYQKRGDTTRAKAYFKQVREKFPGTAAARLASREDA